MQKAIVNLLPFVVWPVYFIVMIGFWNLLSIQNPGFDWAIVGVVTQLGLLPFAYWVATRLVNSRRLT